MINNKSKYNEHLKNQILKIYIWLEKCNNDHKIRK
jgi:hypothetical protein